MNKRYKVIQEMLEAFARFEETVANDEGMTFDNFLAHATQAAGHQSVLAWRQVAGSQEPQVMQRANKKEESIAILVAYLYRYAKVYVKKALEGSVLQSIDDFSYLIILLTHESLSKTELITKSVHEKTSGMEIIKRLVRLGLMTQYDDAHDKRSQRVAISPMGRGVLFAVLDRMGNVSTLMSGNLSDAEKNTLIHLLKKLDHFHYDIFTTDRNEALETIVATHVGDGTAPK